MKITHQAALAHAIPADDLRSFLRPYGDRDTVDLNDHDESSLVDAAFASLLRPMPGTPAAALAAALGDIVPVIPFLTIHGATLASVARTWVPYTQSWNGMTGRHHCMTFAYDDGVRMTEWVDYGDHGATLVVADDGTPAFYSVMTSDGYFDSRIAAGEAGLSFTIVDRLHELDDRRIGQLAAAVDPRQLAGLPRIPVTAGAAQPAQPGMSLRQLYAAPPSPRGRAPLGRR